MPLLLSRILNKPLWTGWMLCRLLADPKHPVQRWMPHTSIECASLCSQSSVTTCSEANIVPTVNLSLALYLPFFSPSLQHPRASTHIRFLAFCSILKSSWLRSFLGYKKKKKKLPEVRKLFEACTCTVCSGVTNVTVSVNQKTDVCLEQAWNKVMCPSCLKWQELFLSNCKWLFIQEKADPRRCNFLHSKKN